MADMTFDERDKEDNTEHALVEYSTYKGNAMIVIRRTSTDKYPLQFGLTKAKMIMDNIESIEKFIADNAKG